MSMNVRNAPNVAVSENETERSFVNSCASRSYRTIPGLVADRLDDEREDRDGEDERREQQVQLRDRPDGDAAADDGDRPVRDLLVGLVLLGLVLRVEFLAGEAVRRTGGAWAASWLSLIAAEARSSSPREHHECGDGTEKDQQFAVHQGVHHRASSLDAEPAAAPVARAVVVETAVRALLRESGKAVSPCTTETRGTGRPRSRGSGRRYPRCRPRSGACVTKGEPIWPNG